MELILPVKGKGKGKYMFRKKKYTEQKCGIRKNVD